MSNLRSHPEGCRSSVDGPTFHGRDVGGGIIISLSPRLHAYDTGNGHVIHGEGPFERHARRWIRWIVGVGEFLNVSRNRHEGGYPVDAVPQTL